MSKKTCKGCGDKIIFSKDEIELAESGHISLSNIKYCTECHKSLNEIPDDFSQSDADPGL